MRFGDGLLAPVAGLAGGWGVAKAARIAAVPVARSRSCGLVAGCCGQRQHTGVGGGGKNRPQSYGRTGASVAASIMCLPTPRPGDAAPGGNLDRGQPPRCDVAQLLPLVDAVRRGRPRRRPARLYGARAYAARGHRQALRRRGIAPALARRGSAHGSSLGVYRWVVERTQHSWPLRRLPAVYRWAVERTLGWLVASVPPVAGALRAACGHPRGISCFGVFPHLFQ